MASARVGLGLIPDIGRDEGAVVAGWIMEDLWVDDVGVIGELLVPKGKHLSAKGFGQVAVPFAVSAPIVIGEGSTL